MSQSISQREFEELFQKHARAIFGHVRALVPNPQDAEEVFQETSATLWTKFDQYQRGTDFRAWACRIAYYKVLKLRDRQHRSPRLFSPQFMEAVDEELIVMSDGLEARSEALAACREQLSASDNELLEDYYGRNVKVKAIAARLKRSADSIYRALRRVHDQLYTCVQKRLSEDS